MSDSRADEWRRALFGAFVDRDRARIAQLGAEPLDALLQTCTRGTHERIFTQALHELAEGVRDVEVADFLASGLEATNPLGLDPASADYVLCIEGPEMALFHRLLEGDAEKLREQFPKALERHRVYWSEIAKAPDDPRARVALGPLAVACLAHDRGIALDVESEYVPGALVRGA